MVYWLITLELHHDVIEALVATAANEATNMFFAWLGRQLKKQLVNCHQLMRNVMKFDGKIVKVRFSKSFTAIERNSIKRQPHCVIHSLAWLDRVTLLDEGSVKSSSRRWQQFNQFFISFSMRFKNFDNFLGNFGNSSWYPEFPWAGTLTGIKYPLKLTMVNSDDLVSASSSSSEVFRTVQRESARNLLFLELCPRANL